ncbi:MAG: hypothetical protein ABI868_20375 [Acidobacteriota bacterium]
MISIRAILIAALFAVVAAGEPAGSPALQQSEGWPAIKQWTADVIVTADCDRSAFDGSRTIIHNRIQTTYTFTNRLSDPPSAGGGAPAVKWSGRATTTYKWAVGTQFRDSIDMEEGSGSFDAGAQLELTDATKISIGRPPARPFTRKKYAGTSLLETTTADDEPPAAELYEAPLPSGVGTMSGDRNEFAYWLLGGVVLNCPARRQWTMRAP